MKRTAVNRTVRTALSVLAVTGLALTAAGCSEEAQKKTKDKIAEEVTGQVDKAVDETYEVTYEVTGEKLESVEFNGGKGTAVEPEIETAATPETPWKKTVTLKGIAAPTVLALPGLEGSKATCKIIYKGEVLEEQSSEEPLVPASCVALSPITG